MDKEVPWSLPTLVDVWGDLVGASGMPVTKMGGMPHTGKEPKTLIDLLEAGWLSPPDCVLLPSLGMTSWVDFQGS